MAKKISQLPESTDIYEGCCFPIVTNDETKKATYGLLLQKLLQDLNIENNFAFNNIGSQSSTLESSASTALMDARKKQINGNNAGDYVVFTFVQSSSSSTGGGGIWFAHIEKTTSNSYVVEMLAGANNNRPTLRLSAAGVLHVRNNMSNQSVIGSLIIKM